MSRSALCRSSWTSAIVESGVRRAAARIGASSAWDANTTSKRSTSFAAVPEGARALSATVGHGSVRPVGVEIDDQDRIARQAREGLEGVRRSQALERLPEGEDSAMRPAPYDPSPTRSARTFRRSSFPVSL